MKNMFMKPNKNMTTCPICGGDLHYEELDQFGLPVGYHSTCTHCDSYSDIWVSGLREVTCGSYTTPDYLSDDAAMTGAEKITEAFITTKLNLAVIYEKLHRSISQNHFSAKGGRQVTA